MRKVTEPPSYFIAVELGGVWPEWLSRPASTPRRVLSELEGEGPAAYAARTAQELSGVSNIQDAVLLCNERTDSAQVEARRVLVQSVLGAMAKTATLTLAAPIHAGERLRGALEALASELGRRVSVRYDASLEEEAISRVATRFDASEEETVVSRVA